jgi:predicted metalloprotease with PDZ domain
VDYYDEGALIWLEADVKIRQLTNGQKSLDDFTHIFHGAPSTGPMVKPYTFDDVVNAMNQVVPYDWKQFFTQRVIRIAPDAPLAGIENGGYRIVYTDKPNELEKMRNGLYKSVDAIASVGLLLRNDGTIVDTIHFGLAAKAGIGPGMKVIAVNGRKFTPEVFEAALVAGKSNKEPLQLLVENTEYYKTYSLDYHDGPRYPHLVRDSSKPDLFDQIMKPKVTTPPSPDVKAEIQ